MKTPIIVPNIEESTIKSLAEATTRNNLLLTEEGVGVLLSISINEDNQE